MLQPLATEYRNKCEFTIGVDPDGVGENLYVVFVSVEHRQTLVYTNISYIMPHSG